MCFPLTKLPPGVDLTSDLVVPGASITRSAIVGSDVCVDFDFDHLSTFVVGAQTKPVVPELVAYYQDTGGAALWGPCLTNGFFVGVSADGRLREVPVGTPGGLYVEVCANGVLGFNAGLAGTGFAVQPVLVSQWLRSGGGPLNGTDPAVPPSGVGRYFLVTGHNVSGRILNQFDRLGGVAVLGYPLTEPLEEVPGFTSQYFQRLKLTQLNETGEVFVEQLGRNFLVMLINNRLPDPTATVVASAVRAPRSPLTAVPPSPTEVAIAAAVPPPPPRAPQQETGVPRPLVLPASEAAKPRRRARVYARRPAVRDRGLMSAAQPTCAGHS